MYARTTEKLFVCAKLITTMNEYMIKYQIGKEQIIVLLMIFHPMPYDYIFF